MASDVPVPPTCVQNNAKLEFPDGSPVQGASGSNVGGFEVIGADYVIEVGGQCFRQFAYPLPDGGLGQNYSTVNGKATSTLI